MNPKTNYQRELEQIIAVNQRENKVPTLLLHACCAPCSSYVLEYLSNYFSTTVFYYNPNITDSREYDLRARELERLIRELPAKYPISFVEGDYEPQRFYETVEGLAQEPEGGARCKECFTLRLQESVKLCQKLGLNYVTTTLTISPLKNAALLNELGEQIVEEQIGEEPSSMFRWLPSDFKKKNGYKRSTELSAEYGLYRQNYCGCIYSKLESESRI